MEKQYKADWYSEIDLTNEYEKWLEVNHIESDDTTEAEWLEQRNKKADAELLDDIKKSGYAYSKTFGVYHPDALVQQIHMSLLMWYIIMQEVIQMIL